MSETVETPVQRPRRMVPVAGGPPEPPPPLTRSARAADELERQLELPDKAAEGPELPPWQVAKLVKYEPPAETLAEASAGGGMAPLVVQKSKKKAPKAKPAPAPPPAPRERIKKPNKPKRGSAADKYSADEFVEESLATPAGPTASSDFESIEELVDSTTGAQDREGWTDAPIPPPVESAYQLERPVVRVGNVAEDTDPGFAEESFSPEDLGLPGSEPEKPKRGRPAAVAAADDVKARGLEDLLAAFPLGDGQHTLRVERLAPKSFYGQQCFGYQGIVRDVLGSDPRWDGSAMDDFIDRFGGGEYLLRVYGPPKRVGQSAIDPATGQPRPRVLSADVRLTVPWVPPAGVPPKPQQLVPDDDDDDEPLLYDFGDQDDADDHDPDDEEPMQPIPIMRPARQGSSPADAKIYETSVSAAERQAERAREERRERDQRRAREQNEVVPMVIEAAQHSADRVLEAQRASQDMMTQHLAEQRRINEEERRRREEAERAALDARREEVERERERLEREAERREEERAKNAKSNDPVEAVARIMQVMQPQGGAQAEILKVQLEQQTREMQRMQQAHEQERVRLDDARRQEVAREREAKEREVEYLRKGFETQLNAERERIKNETDRAERRARDAEERAEMRVRDAEERASRVVRESEEKIERIRREAQAETDRRLAELQRMFELTKTSDERSHERELRSLQATYEGNVKVTSTVADTQLKLATQQLAEAKAEIKRLREQVDNAPDPLERIAEIKEQGSLLGLVEKTPDKADFDWKAGLFQLGATVLQSAPEVAREIAKMRAPAPPAALPGQPAPHQLPPGQFYPNPQMQPQAPMLPPGARRAPLPPPVPFGVPGMQVHAAPPEAMQQQWSGVPVLSPPPAPPPAQFVAQPQFAQAPQFAPQLPATPAPAPVALPPVAAQMQLPLPQAAAPAPAADPAAPDAAAPPQEGLDMGSDAGYDDVPPAVAFDTAVPTTPAAPTVDVGQYIGLLRPQFEGAFMQSAPATMFVADLRGSLGPMLPQIAAGLSVDAVTDALLAMPDGARSPLVTARGQEWLEDVLKEAKRQ